METTRSPLLKRLPALFEIPAPNPPRLLRRIELMERNIMLPVKAAFIAIVLISFNHTPWAVQISSVLDITIETVQFLFLFYIIANVLFIAPLLNVHSIPLALVQWTTVTSILVDGLFIAGMALITGGLDSVLFWFFVALIVRNSISVPPGFSQLFLSFAVSLCYVLVAVLDVVVLSNLDDTTRRAFDLTPHEELGQPFLLRLTVLWLTAICGYGAQILLERQRQAIEEAEEFATREGQLRSAGRLAAEFAHQIKNPLAIINNTVFSLKRCLPADASSSAKQQLEIIEEEIVRADRVITEIMGYARLSEGRVEKLNVIQELDAAIAQTFPAAVPTKIRVHRDFARDLPSLLMQRNHFSEIVLNLLKNSREAVGDAGNIHVSASSTRDQAIEISVRDNGPGIPADKQERIFEAYYSTKESGSGMGLSIARHNAELYGGTMRVESELGKGAKFTVIFPAKALMKPLPK